MVEVCDNCKHLMPEGADAHVCPDDRYLEIKKDLMDGANLAVEFYTQDELEAYAASLRSPTGDENEV